MFNNLKDWLFSKYQLLVHLLYLRIVSIIAFLKSNLKTIDRIFSSIFKFFFFLFLFFVLLNIWKIDEKPFDSPFTYILLKNTQLIYTVIVISVMFTSWSNKNSKSILNRRILTTLIFIVVLSTPIVLLILHLGRVLSIVEGIKIGTADGWLAFFGSIIGGVITMMALFFTIQHENEKRRIDQLSRDEEKMELNKQKELSLIPFIEFHLREDIINLELNLLNPIIITVRNSSTNHALKLKVNELSTFIDYRNGSNISTYNNPLTLIDGKSCLNQEISILQSKQVHEILLKYNDPKKVLEKNNSIYFHINMLISYSNIILTKEYSYRIQFTFKIKHKQKNTTFVHIRTSTSFITDLFE